MQENNHTSEAQSSGVDMKEMRQLLILLRKERSVRLWNLGFRLVKYTVAIALVTVIIMTMMRTSGWTIGSMASGGSDDAAGSDDEHIALVQVMGIIAADTPASSDWVKEGLRDAYDHDNTAAVLVEIDSPGGSPVQAGEIYDEIMRLREMHSHIPVFAMIRDLGASGAYYVAVAANEIYANRASLAGSIGVISAGFGFQDLLAKIGVERRLYTAGDHKGFLDPFVSERPQERRAWEGVLEAVRNQFVERVKQSRGHVITDKRAYSGLLWSGEQAQEIGLVDHIGDIDTLRERLGIDEVVDFTVSQPYFEELAEYFGVSVARILTQQRMQLLFGVGR